MPWVRSAANCSRWAWAQAAFPLGDGEDWAAEIDALAVRRGDGPFTVVDRSFVAYPPTDYNRIGTSFVAGCGTALRVEIDKKLLFFGNGPERGCCYLVGFLGRHFFVEFNASLFGFDGVTIAVAVVNQDNVGIKAVYQFANLAPGPFQQG
jgi:hypothetical protein